MMNASKRAVTIAAVVASVFGVSMLGGATRAQTVFRGDCVNTPGGALCTNAGVPSAYAEGITAYAAVPNGFAYQPGTVFLPGAVAHNGEVIGRDPDANIRLMLMKDPEPMDQAGQ